MSKNNTRKDGADSNETVWSKFGNQNGETVYISIDSAAKVEQQIHRALSDKMSRKHACDVIIGNPPHVESVAEEANNSRHLKKMLGKVHDVISDAIITPAPVLEKMLQGIGRTDKDLMFINPRFGKTDLQDLMKERGYKRKSTKKVNGVSCDIYTKNNSNVE